MVLPERLNVFLPSIMVQPNICWRFWWVARLHFRAAACTSNVGKEGVILFTKKSRLQQLKSQGLGHFEAVSSHSRKTPASLSYFNAWGHGPSQKCPSLGGGGFPTLCFKPFLCLKISWISGSELEGLLFKCLTFGLWRHVADATNPAEKICTSLPRTSYVRQSRFGNTCKESSSIYTPRGKKLSSRFMFRSSSWHKFIIFPWLKHLFIQYIWFIILHPRKLR